MSDAECNFWDAFEYNPETNRWLLRADLAPMDMLAICEAKTVADRETVARIVSDG